MGIDVNNKIVSFNEAHEDLVNTSINSNPTKTTKNGFTIYSIFKRMKTKKNKGDGNPLIYALKNKNGFRINRKEIKKFFFNLDIILNRILAEKRYTLIIILPSKHKIGNFLAKRIRKRIPSATYSKDFFRKIIIQEVIDSINVNSVANKKHNKEIKTLLSEIKKNPTKEFTMKEVPHNIRKYFNPLKVNKTINLNSHESILIIDDLLSSGTTIKSAKDMIHNIKNCSNIDGLCLLSDL